jgi:5'-phosphate synthase pdxT subunit
MKRIGVLALQGGFAEHIASLHGLGVEAVAVRTPGQLDGLNGLVIPGGESTTICKLMREYRLDERVRRLVAEGLPVFGTCAGMVLLAQAAPGAELEPLAAMQIRVRRNGFGRQRESFETDIDVPVLGLPAFHAVFIRAPWVETVGENTETLATLDDGTAVAVREKNLVATSFHPELTPDLRFHDFFLSIVNGKLEPKEG